ncbi:MAG: sulfurtransferase [Thermodesulfobacteriota bacterium]
MTWRKKKSNKKEKWIGLTFWTWLSLFSIISLGPTAHAIPNGGYAHPEALVQPEELKVLIEKKDPPIRMIDIREKLKYLAGHLPGAVHVWRPDIVDQHHPIPGMMASKEQIETLLGNSGISEKDILIIYSDGSDNGRLWWVLAYYGFPLRQLRILDGGLDGWKARGYPTEMLPPKIEKTLFRLPREEKFRKPLLCSLPEVKSALQNRNKVVLDVRSQKEFSGEDLKEGAARPGRIPGVVWIEWTEALVEKGPFKGFWKSAEEIKRIFAAKGVTPDKDIFVY